jgi:hypothetical protein
LARLNIPTVPADLIVTRLVIAIAPGADGIEVVVLTDDARHPHHLAYISLLLKALVQSAEGNPLIEGLPNHPILRIAGDED